MNKDLIAFFLLFIVVACTSNKNLLPSKKEIFQAEVLIRQGRLDAANQKLDELVKIYPTSIEIAYRAGMVKYHLNDKQKALGYLKKADSLSQGTHQDVLFSSGVCSFEIGQYTEAEAYFNRFKEVNIDSSRKEKVEGYLSKIIKVKDLMKYSDYIIIESMPSFINTVNDEFLAFPTLDNEKLLFTRRIKTGGNVTEQLMMAKKDGINSWTAAETFGLENIVTGSISGDGKILVSTTCERLMSIGSCDLMITYLIDGKWSNPKNMTDLINSTEWDAQPVISADGNMILFSSSRKGGFGARDLYYTVKGSNGWQIPENLGNSVNTSANEESPYLHPDNRTLYFRSDHERGLGSYDIYMSRYNDSTKVWSEPVNLGYPINTVGDDGALTIGADGETAFLTSNRSTLDSKRPDFNIYTFKLPIKYQSIPTTFVKVITKDKISMKPLRSKVIIEETASNKLILESVLDNDGALTIPVPAGKDYSILVSNEGYYPISKQFNPTAGNGTTNPLIIEVDLEKINKDVPIIFNNILFESGSAILKNENNVDLEYLLKLLKENISLKVKITGHTDNTGQAAFNQTLSENRAKSVAAYLFKNGISQERIITEGKGDQKPITSNDSEEGRKMNRRTEVYIL